MNILCFLLAAFGCWLLPAAPGAGAAVVELLPAKPAPGELFLVRIDDLPSGVVPGLRSGAGEFAMWPTAIGRWEGLVAVDRDESDSDVTVEVIDVARRATSEPLQELSVPLESRTYPEQHLRVSDRMVNLSPEDQQRAGRESRLIRRALKNRSADRLWNTSFAVPVEGPVTSPFGVRRVYNGTPKSYHSGLDIAAPRGTPVAAASEGRVALSGDYFYTGNTVFIDHGHGLYSAYFHLEEVTVGEGDTVSAGTPIGTVGSTGRSTGPHLHWGIYLAGIKVDPLSLVQLTSGGAGGGESP